MKTWTKGEEKILSENAHRGVAWLAAVLERSPSSIKCKASEMGKSLRRPGVRKGLRLGQPRSRKLSELVRDPELAEALADGKQTNELVAIVKANLDPNLPRCPSCGERPQTKRSTGLCEVCHYEHMAQAWREGTVRRKARAEYLSEREQGKRRVKCTACGFQHSPRLDREGRKSDRLICPECGGACVEA